MFLGSAHSCLKGHNRIRALGNACIEITKQIRHKEPKIRGVCRVQEDASTVVLGCIYSTEGLIFLIIISSQGISSADIIVEPRMNFSRHYHERAFCHEAFNKQRQEEVHHQVDSMAAVTSCACIFPSRSADQIQGLLFCRGCQPPLACP